MRFKTINYILRRKFNNLKTERQSTRVLREILHYMGIIIPQKNLQTWF